ncbi:MAG: GlxA family transcriptional regulator [Pseudomonadales bacterium]
MILRPDNDGSFTVSFLLLPEYAMVALLSAIEPMRVANRFAGREVFRWQLLSEEGPHVLASNQMSLHQVKPLERDDYPPNIIVCSSFNPQQHLSHSAMDWLRRAKRAGALLGAMDTGCYLLAQAGLLAHRTVTLHWEAIPAFSASYPQLKVSHQLFEIERDLITCAGGTAAMDMLLHIIQCELGDALALQVCEQFIQAGMRQSSDKQRIDLAARLQVHHPGLLRVLVLLENALDRPLSVEQMAQSAHLSVRQLERLFNQYLKTAPKQYHMARRLAQSRVLLLQSSLSVARIGEQCGFNSSSHFSRCYRREFGCSPSEQRA